MVRGQSAGTLSEIGRASFSSAFLIIAMNYGDHPPPHLKLGTVCWPDGADLDPVVLWSLVTGHAVPRYGHAPAVSNF